MSNLAIEAVGLSKSYYLGADSSRQRLQQALSNWIPGMRPPAIEPFWALQDVSFSVGRGESVGIIGRNGAGKSTLLKILSRVTKPTEGRARLHGRLGTLLEVGTGFHPEVSGRDNIFLSGSILGMGYREIAKKFDEIVEFSGVEAFIDTPVKRYSSGMYVRLAFSVALFLEPDILIVDEVLAVGDAAFQQKSLAKLSDASANQGRTILFVSHSLAAIRAFCGRVLLLEKGRLIFDGPTEDGIGKYFDLMPQQLNLKVAKLDQRSTRTSGAVRFAAASCHDGGGRPTWQVFTKDTVTLRFELEASERVESLMMGIRLYLANRGDILTTVREIISNGPVEAGWKRTVELVLPNIMLRPGEFSLYVWLCRKDGVVFYDVIDDNVDLPLLRVMSESTDPYAREGILSIPYQFRVEGIVAADRD